MCFSLLLFVPCKFWLRQHWIAANITFTKRPIVWSLTCRIQTESCLTLTIIKCLKPRLWETKSTAVISPGKTSQLERGNRPKQHTKSRSNDDKIQHEPTEHIREKKAKRYTKWKKKKKAKISKGDNLLSNHKLYFPSCLNQINESWDTARCEKWYLIEIMDHRNSDPLRESFAPALIYNSIFLISTDDSSEKWPEALKVAGNLASHGGGRASKQVCGFGIAAVHEATFLKTHLTLLHH